MKKIKQRIIRALDSIPTGKAFTARRNAAQAAAREAEALIAEDAKRAQAIAELEAKAAPILAELDRHRREAATTAQRAESLACRAERQVPPYHSTVELGERLVASACTKSYDPTTSTADAAYALGFEAGQRPSNVADVFGHFLAEAVKDRRSQKGPQREPDADGRMSPSFELSEAEVDQALDALLEGYAAGVAKREGEAA